MNPVQGSLHVREPRRESPYHICIGRYSEANTVDRSVQGVSRVRKQVDFRTHARLDVLELSFSKVANHPPSAGINQSEDLLGRPCICTLRNREVGDSGVERSIDPAVVQVVLGGLDR